MYDILVAIPAIYCNSSSSEDYFRKTSEHTSPHATLIKNPPQISTSREPKHIFCDYQPVGAWCASLRSYSYSCWSIRSWIVHWSIVKRLTKSDGCCGWAPRSVAISRTWVRMWLDDDGDDGGGDQDERTTSTTRTSHHKTESSTEAARARLPQPRHDGPPKCATTMRTGVRRARWRHDDDETRCTV